MIRKTALALSVLLPFLIVQYVGISLGLDFESDRWFVRSGSMLWFMFSVFVAYSCGKNLNESWPEKRR